MRYRRFGNTGLEVSEIGFGSSRLGGIFARNGSSKEALALLRNARDAGVTFFDTADMYSQGEAEKLLGQAFRFQRDKIVLATKGGYCLPAQRKLIARVKPVLKPIINALGIKRKNLPAMASGSLSQNFSAAYLIGALEGSLRRLKTDYIDIYQLHSPPAAVIEAAEFVDTLETLKRQGKIRFWGIATDSAADAAVALKLPQVSSVQLGFGLLDLEALELVLKHVGENGPGIIARGCFGGGFLKESLTQEQLQETTGKWERILAYRGFAAENNRSTLELALQFVLRAPAVSVALLGMRTEEHLRGNLDYYSCKPLSVAEYGGLSFDGPASVRAV